MHTTSRNCRSSVADAVRASVRHAGPLLCRLAYLSATIDTKTGQYMDPLLCLDFDAGDVDAELRRQHRKVFVEWLTFSLEQQEAEVLDFLQEQSNPRQFLRRWTEPFNRMVPRDATEAERALFVNDSKMTTSIVEDRLPAEEGAIEKSTIKTSSGKTPTMAALSKPGVKKFLHRVLAKEHLAFLWEKGKIETNQYMAEVNKLRDAEALPPIGRVCPGGR